MNWYDGEMNVQRQKEMARAAAEEYWSVRHLNRRSSRPTAHLRLLASVGGMLVTVGYRLQAEYDHLAASAADGPDGLRLSSNGSGPTP